LQRLVKIAKTSGNIRCIAGKNNPIAIRWISYGVGDLSFQLSQNKSMNYCGAITVASGYYPQQ